MAIATVSGKAYFLLVNALKERNIAFSSIVPGQPIPAEAKVTITTEKEKSLVNHDRIVILNSEKTPRRVINEVVRILQDKEVYEKVVVGVDPGKVLGLAVIVDGKVSETCNCFSLQEAEDKIKSIVKDFEDSAGVVSVKIGNGVPTYKTLLEKLDAALPAAVKLEVVSEAGTDRHIDANMHRRGLRDIISAIRIAGRTGHNYTRRKTCEADS